MPGQKPRPRAGLCCTPPHNEARRLVRHLTALHHEDNTHWIYGSAKGGLGYPIGACVDGHRHPTEVEARECYSQYQRDNVKLDGRLSSWSDCAECGDPTKTCAEVAGDGYNLATLCTKHLTPDMAFKHLGLNGPAGDAWVS